MEEETKGKIRVAVKFILGDPDPTTKDRERIKKDPNIKNQMQKMTDRRNPSQFGTNKILFLFLSVFSTCSVVSLCPKCFETRQI